MPSFNLTCAAYENPCRTIPPDLVKRINLMADTVGGAAELISLDPLK